MPDLTSVEGIGPSTAQELREQGVHSAEELAQEDSEDITVPTGNSETLIQRAKQMTISSNSMADILDDYDTQTFVSTGLDALDEATGGGWEAKTIGLVYGKSGKGKTQLAFSTLAQAASEGTAVYLQTENQSDSIAQRILDMAEGPEILENIERYEAYSVDDQFSSYLKIEEEVDDISVLVIDSFTGQFRVTDRFGGRETLGERSDEIGRHLQKLGAMARTLEIPVVLTGQVYPQPEAYGREDKIWGGEKLKHYVSYYVRMTEGQGELKKAVLQNHPGLDEAEVEMVIDGEGLTEM